MELYSANNTQSFPLIHTHYLHTLLNVQHLLHSSDDIEGLWSGDQFQFLSVWHRDVRSSHPYDWSIQVVKSNTCTEVIMKCDPHP